MSIYYNKYLILYITCVRNSTMKIQISQLKYTLEAKSSYPPTLVQMYVYHVLIDHKKADFNNTWPYNFKFALNFFSNI